MKIDNLSKVLANQPSYRFKQVYRAIFLDLLGDWSLATNLPLTLREKLAKDCSLEINGKVYSDKRQDSQKVIITLADGLKIETVLLKHNDGRQTVCVSSQAGCSLGCRFCATGQMGFERNLNPWEMVEQVLFFARLLKRNNQKVTNVVFMGMGEPFLNYDNVLRAIRILNDKDSFNLGARKISISTCGIIPGIKRLAKEKLQVNLAISLHAPSDKLRDSLMSINKKYPIKDILKEATDYVKATSRRLMFEYLMIKGINDSPSQAKELANLMKNKLFLVNLIPYNQTGIYQSSSQKAIAVFKQILEKSGVAVTLRHSFGQEIEAACGQLANKKVKK